MNKEELEKYTMGENAHKQYIALMERKDDVLRLKVIQKQIELYKLEIDRLNIEKEIRKILSETYDNSLNSYIEVTYPKLYNEFYEAKKRFRSYYTKTDDAESINERIEKEKINILIYNQILNTCQYYKITYDKVLNESSQRILK